MKEHELREALNSAAEGCQLSEYRKRQILVQMKGEEIVKKKLTVSVALVMIITLLTLSVAAALVHSTIVDQLFGSSENAPAEVAERIQTPQEITETTLGTLSLDEWFYDGMSLHTAFSISNPTGEPLFYTLDGIHLNGEHITYNRLRTEGAGDSGFLLGGTVDGTAMPAGVSLYNQGDELYTFDENGKFTARAAIPEGTATLKISVAVWKPINTVERIDYTRYEGINITETKDHLTTDDNGFSQLWLFRPEEYTINYDASQSGAQVYKDAYKELGWLELLDIIEVETTVHLSKDQAVRVLPKAMTYDQNGYQMTLEHFDMSHAGGKLEGWVYGDESSVKQLFASHGLFLVDKDSESILSNGCFWDDQPQKDEGIRFTMNLIPVTNLPETVYIAPATSYNDCLDEKSPHYDPAMPKSENVIEGWEFDFSRAIEISLKTAP